jgi:hypothetical protein
MRYTLPQKDRRTRVPLDCALTGPSSPSRAASSCDGMKPLFDRVGSWKTLKIIQDIPLGYDVYNVQHFTQPSTEPAASLGRMSKGLPTRGCWQAQWRHKGKKRRT